MINLLYLFVLFTKIKKSNMSVFKKYCVQSVRANSLMVVWIEFHNKEGKHFTYLSLSIVSVKSVERKFTVVSFLF
jgi:hypothetical protein